VTPSILLSILLAGGQSGQSAPPQPHASGIAIHLERRAERFDYHIENPSSVEPGPPVPHFFEQRYRSNNTWIFANLVYRLRGSAASTEFGITPRITTPGSDVDTFFQPSGDIVTTGTRGDVQLRSFAIRQWIEMSTWRGWIFGATIGYRRSEMDFLPSDRIVTHTQPSSQIRQPVGGDETTWSHVVDSGVTAARSFNASEHWRVSTGFEALPVTRARLTISLPLKYPGQLIRQDTFGFGARGTVAVARQWRSVVVGVGVTTGGTWGYRRTARYHERRAGGEVFVRMSPR
jgi:hypothetical protein